MMSDNELGNKPKETISYHGHAYVSGNRGFGVTAGGNLVFSRSSPGGVRRVAKRVTGTVVEETSEYFIVMTRKDQLVKIRPEDIINRKLFSKEEASKRASIALEGVVGFFALMMGALIFILGSVGCGLHLLSLAVS